MIVFELYVGVRWQTVDVWINTHWEKGVCVIEILFCWLCFPTKVKLWSSDWKRNTGFHYNDASNASVFEALSLYCAHEHIESVKLSEWTKKMNNSKHCFRNKSMKQTKRHRWSHLIIFIAPFTWCHLAWPEHLHSILELILLCLEKVCWFSFFLCVFTVDWFLINVNFSLQRFLATRFRYCDSAALDPTTYQWKRRYVIAISVTVKIKSLIQTFVILNSRMGWIFALQRKEIRWFQWDPKWDWGWNRSHNRE